MSLAPGDRRLALAVAEEAIRTELTGGSYELPSVARVSEGLQRPGASFVTLERGEQLLGCRGTLDARRPLFEDIATNAVLTAFHDPRFRPITRNDFTFMSLKVSVLSQPEATDWGSYGAAIRAVRPGMDGLVVASGSARATLLPSVWSHLPDPEGFLAALWDKAGIRPGEWRRGTVVYRYTTEEFASPGPRTVEGPSRDLPD